MHYKKYQVAFFIHTLTRSRSKVTTPSFVQAVGLHRELFSFSIGLAVLCVLQLPKFNVVNTLIWMGLDVLRCWADILIRDTWSCSVCSSTVKVWRRERLYHSLLKYVAVLLTGQLEFDAHDMGDRLFLLWPLVLTHRITETSPLWTLKPDDLVFDKFEVSGAKHWNSPDVQLLVTHVVIQDLRLFYSLIREIKYAGRRIDIYHTTVGSNTHCIF